MGAADRYDDLQGVELWIQRRMLWVQSLQAPRSRQRIVSAASVLCYFVIKKQAAIV